MQLLPSFFRPGSEGFLTHMRYRNLAGRDGRGPNNVGIRRSQPFYCRCDW
jgi:hypothetical protein